MTEEKKKKGKRKLSRFLCREMLYDYVTDNLDGDRKEAIREFLAADEQSREELECLKEGIEYAEKLSKISVSVPLLDQLKKSEAPTTQALNKVSFRNWPMPLRLGAEALVISGFVAIVMSLVPWHKMSFLQQNKTTEIEIANVEGNKDHHTESDEPPQQLAAPTDTVTEPAEPTEPDAQTVAKVTPPPVKEQPKPEETSKPIVQDTTNVAQKTDDKQEKPKGIVFRAFMKIGALNESTPKMADAIRKLGGERAGEVELGWRRPSGASYFHFSLPESNYDALLTELQSYGLVRIFKEPHRRVMPAGKIRFILMVEPTD